MFQSKIFIGVISISFFLLSTNSFSQNKTLIAVIDLDAENISLSESRIISARLRTDLFNTNKFMVIERDKMDEILQEQGFQLSGCTTTECVVEVGMLIGVKQMVAGNIGKIGNLYTINIRLIDVETGAVLKTATEDCECGIEKVLTQSVRNVSQILAERVSQVDSYNRSINKEVDYNKPEWETLKMTQKEYKEFKKTNLKNDEWRMYNREIKSTPGNMLSSLLIPGIGHFTLRKKRGYFYVGADCITILMIIYYNKKADINDDYDEWRLAKKNADNLKYVLIANRLLSALDIGISTSNHNRKVQQKYKVTFSPKIENNHFVVAAGIELLW